MAKCRIEADERYPVFYFTDATHIGVEVEVDDETLARWNRIYADWEAVQSEMGDAVKLAVAARRGRQPK